MRIGSNTNRQMGSGLTLRRPLFLVVVLIVVAAACTTGGDSQPEPTPTHIRSETAQQLQRTQGVFSVAPDTMLWVTQTDEILITTADIELAHPFTLGGQGVTFDSTESGTVEAVVSDDQSVVAVPVTTTSGFGGVALFRDDGHNMALHLYGDPSADIGSIKFMPEVGLTLVSLGGHGGSRVIAINNYGIMQFELPVTDALGKIRYSPDELRYLVIDRRPFEEELELVAYAEPGESTIFRASETSEEDDDLYRSLSAAIASWK